MHIRSYLDELALCYDLVWVAHDMPEISRDGRPGCRHEDAVGRREGKTKSATTGKDGKKRESQNTREKDSEEEEEEEEQKEGRVESL